MGKADEFIKQLKKPPGKYPTPWGKPPEPAHPNCPQCGRPKVTRWNTNIGKWFFACSGYPACKWSCNIRYVWSMQFFENNPDYPTRPRQREAAAKRKLEEQLKHRERQQQKQAAPKPFHTGFDDPDEDDPY